MTKAKPKLRRRAVLIGIGALACASPARAQGLRDLLSPPDSLEAMALRVERDFPDVHHARPSDIARLSAAPRPVLVFDVRERVEFEVSRLPGAERIAPNASETMVLAQIGSRLHERAILFYCSVGQRSSRMAERAGPALRRSGAHEVYSLRGGVFAWHDEQRPLIDMFGPTPYVHPFNGAWRRLLSRPDLARMHMRPRPS